MGQFTVYWLVIFSLNNQHKKNIKSKGQYNMFETVTKISPAARKGTVPLNSV